MQSGKIIFFRNDDVGLYSSQQIATELVELTELFIDENIPISHGVVPDAVSIETVKWLRGMKSNYPDIIGIDQHGYKHIKHDRGEFGGRRCYKDQERDIKAGMDFMKQNFGNQFSWCFTSPWVQYNRHTKRICDVLGYKVFSGGVSPILKARLFNMLGRLLNLNVLGPKEVSYHRSGRFTQPGFRILEISPCIDVIQDYKRKILKPHDSIGARYNDSRRHFDVIGFLLHQWVFDNKDKIKIMMELLQELKQDKDNSFCLFEDIVNRYT